MKRVHPRWLLLLVLPLLASCALPVTVESRVDPDHRGDLKRVFVVSHLYQVSERFAGPCERFIVEELASVGVDARLHSVDPLALDEALPVAMALEHAPDALLLVEPIEKGGPRVNMVSMAKIRLTLRDLTTDSIYWRANFTVESGDGRTPVGTITARQFARALVERLGEDGLLGSAT